MEYTSTQPIADQLKALVGQVKNADQRGSALAAIQRLERAEWHPKAWAAAIWQTPGEFEMSNGQYTGYTPPTEDQTFNAAAAVQHLIQKYQAELDYINGAPQNADAADELPANVTRLQTL